MALMHMKCIRRCWDSKRTMRYWPGDEDNIDTANPVAKHFQVIGPAKVVVSTAIPTNLDAPEISATVRKKRKAKAEEKERLERDAAEKRR